MSELPVFLIHGINDTAETMRSLSDYLTEQGRTTHALTFDPNEGSAPIATLAEQIEAFVFSRIGDEQSFDMIGFSMGALSSRTYLLTRGGHLRVEHYVNISGPQQGTWAAYLSGKAGIKDMRPSSALVGQLSSLDHLLADKKVTSIYTPLDGIILPAKSTELGYGECHKVRVLIHPWMLEDKRVFKLVEAALKA